MRQIAESVEALSMLKDQICGMYGALEQRSKSQSEHVQALTDAELALARLIGKIPTDAITLEGIQRATARVETVAETIPVSVTRIVSITGGAIADAFAARVEPEVAKIKAAAMQAARASNEYAAQATKSVNQAVVTALIVTLGVVTLLTLAAFNWYVPSRADIDADRAEVQRMEGVIQTLKERGGLAQVIQCGTHLCVRTDETIKTLPLPGIAKGDTYRVVRGY